MQIILDEIPAIHLLQVMVYPKKRAGFSSIKYLCERITPTEDKMKLKKVRVTEFQSILDSGEFEIEDITCLVGKNEAGKMAYGPVIGVDMERSL